MFILYCRVIGQWLPTSRQSFGDQLGSDRQSIGDRSATVSWAFVFDCRKSATFWRSVGNRSAISRRLKTMSGLSATAATGRRSVTNQSATSRRPQKPFYDRFGRREVSLAATKTSLRPNRPCNLLQPVGDQSPTVGVVCNRCNWSAISRQPVGDHQKPFYDRFGRREVSLAATKTSLRPNRPCNLLQPVGDQSPTSLQPRCNLPATTRNFGRKEVPDRL